MVGRQGADRALHEERNACAAEALDPTLEARKRAGYLRRRLVVRGVGAVDAHFHGERGPLGQKLSDRLRHHRGVGVQRDQKALRQRVLVDRGEVTAGKDFAARERQPQHAGALDDVEDLA